ncbi:MAG: hypothetical protein HOV81_01080 [Kofleriaceae bacterium]|nr:hypothetical protein [Kofleriaceae bacterium]
MTELQPVAWEAVATELAVMTGGAAKELGWEPKFDRVTANAELVYAHFPQIGCVGVLLERATGRVHVLGSANPAEAYIWAYYRGFDISGGNRLVITAVHDIEPTIEILKLAFRAPYVRHELAPRFATPPVTVELHAHGLHSMLRELRETTAFEFEANPQ